MSMYQDYLKERLNQEMIENEYGFIIYSLQTTSMGNQVFIHDIFIKVEARMNKHGTTISNDVKKIAMENQCTHAMAMVDTQSNGSTKALAFQLSCGMSIKHIVDNRLIYTFMELNVDEED